MEYTISDLFSSAEIAVLVNHIVLQLHLMNILDLYLRHNLLMYLTLIYCIATNIYKNHLLLHWVRWLDNSVMLHVFHSDDIPRVGVLFTPHNYYSIMCWLLYKSASKDNYILSLLFWLYMNIMLVTYIMPVHNNIWYYNVFIDYIIDSYCISSFWRYSYHVKV